MKLEKVIELLSSRECNPGLERIVKLLDIMGNPQDKLKIVHIAGTNGKGSTAEMLSRIMRRAGYRVGLFTSPYLVEACEQILVNGSCIQDKEVDSIYEYISSLSVENMPTEFELTVAIAFEHFLRENCDIVIVEAGMGGLGDATNVIKRPLACVFTNIGIDHTQFLGNTLEEIALQKAGIIKEGASVICYDSSEITNAVFEKVSREKGCEIVFADFDKITVGDKCFDYSSFKGIKPGLIGAHQRKNCAVVLEAVKALRKKGFAIDDESVLSGLSEARITARFEILSEKPLFILDGGHNYQGALSFVATLEECFKGRKFTFIMGVMSDKAYEEMLECFSPYIKELYAVSPDNPRALSAEELSRCAEKYAPSRAFEVVEEAVKEAVANNKEVCAVGSLYMAGDIKKAFYKFK